MGVNKPTNLRLAEGNPRRNVDGYSKGGPLLLSTKDGFWGQGD